MTAAPIPLSSRADTFEALGLGWRATAMSRTVRLTVRRIRKEGGSLRGYVDVEFKPDGAPRERLAGEVVNLSSGRDRVTFANRLAEKRPGPEWRAIIDAFCVEVEARESAGPEFVKIGRMPRPTDGGWLLEGLLERGQTTGLHADGGVGKSWIGLAAAVSVETGVEILPGYRPTHRTHALYCDYETDAQTMSARVEQIARGAGIEPPEITYVHMEDPFADCTEFLLARVQAEGIGLIVVDSVEAAMAGSVSAGAGLNEGPSRLNRALRQLGVSAFLIDHINSEQGTQKEVARKAYGSIFKRNWQRASFHLKQSREPGPDKLKHLGLFNVKRNNGKEFDPVGLAWEINDEWCRWWREDIEDPELEQALPTAQRIAAYLRREGPSQPSTIVEGTGLSRTAVASMLSRRHDLFMKTTTGLWWLVPQQPERDDEIDDVPLQF